MKKLCISIGFFLAFIVLFAQNNENNSLVSAQLDTNKILIGQQAHLILSASYLTGDTLIFPSIKDSIAGKIEIVSMQQPDTSFENNLKKTTITKVYTITSFDSGYYAIPPFKFVHQKDTLETEALLFTVNTIPIDTSKSIKDINDIIPVHYTFFNRIIDWLKDNYIWLIGVIILLAILLYALKYYLDKRKEKQKEQTSPEVVIPPHIEALNRLKTTEDKKLWQSDQIKEYYSEITDILRNYIERNYSMAAMEKTTDEIMQGLRLKPIKQKDKNDLYELFRLADLVKFAKEKPVADENENAIIMARNFVNNTKIEPKVNNPNNEKIENND